MTLLNGVQTTTYDAQQYDLYQYDMTEDNTLFLDHLTLGKHEYPQSHPMKVLSELSLALLPKSSAPTLVHPSNQIDV